MYLISCISKKWSSALKLNHSQKCCEILGDGSKNERRRGFCFVYLMLCQVQLLEKRIVWAGDKCFC